MLTKLIAFGAGVAFFLTAAEVVAHHAFAAEFDADKPITLRGTVTKMEWVNPHSWLYIDVKGTDGQVVNWALELGPVNQLYRRGWTKHSVPTGVEVVIEGYAAKNGHSRANGRTVKFPDGRELFAGSSGTGAPSDGRDPTERK